MSDTPEKESHSTDFSTLLASLISNPEALSKMSDIISKIGSGTNSSNSPQSPQNPNNIENLNINNANNSVDFDGDSPTFQKLDTQSIANKLPEILSKISSVKSEDSLATKQQIALLLAIKPYLSEHRKELIDTFIRMNKLSAIFKNLT